MNTGTVAALVSGLVLLLQLLGYTVSADQTQALTALIGNAATTIAAIVGLVSSGIAIWHSIDQSKALKASQAALGETQARLNRATQAKRS